VSSPNSAVAGWNTVAPVVQRFVAVAAFVPRRLRELGPEGRRLYDYNQFLASFHTDYFPFIPLKLASHAALRLLEGIDFDWISSKISGFVS